MNGAGPALRGAYGPVIAQLSDMGMSPVRRAFVILGVVAVVVALFLVLAQDNATLKVRSGIGADDPRHASYIAALVGADMTRGNDFDVLTNGDQVFPAMLDALRGARRRINFETYIYGTGEIANQFTTALEEAARRGVRVNLVVDAVGGSMDDAHVKRLETAGCRVAKFNPIGWYSLEEMNYRTHRKILVVDGEIGFTGGVGVDDQWLGNAQDAEHWRDTHVRMRGPIVRLLEAAFYENFTEAYDEVTPELDQPAPAPPREEGAAMAVRSSPSGGSNELKQLYLLALASARKTIDITTPYFVTDESSRWSLKEAVGRGVRIRILVEGDITDAMPVKYASRDAYELLLGLGIEMYEYKPTMMHTKSFVVDGAWSMFGSANFDNRSLELNDELNVAVASHSLAARFLQDFEQDLRVSARLDLEQWRKRSLLQKSRENFWSYFGEVF
jgi:cardiolipin synthase